MVAPKPSHDGKGDHMGSPLHLSADPVAAAVFFFAVEGVGVDVGGGEAASAQLRDRGFDHGRRSREIGLAAGDIGDVREYGVAHEAGAPASRAGRLRDVSRHVPRYAALVGAGLAASFLTIHPAGIAGLMARLDLTLAAAFKVDVVFWPGDVVKNLLAAAVALAVFRAFPDLLRSRR